jgi:hypothetical protein
MSYKSIKIFFILLGIVSCKLNNAPSYSENINIEPEVKNIEEKLKSLKYALLQEEIELPVAKTGFILVYKNPDSWAQIDKDKGIFKLANRTSDKKEITFILSYKDKSVQRTVSLEVATQKEVVEYYFNTFIKPKLKLYCSYKKECSTSDTARTSVSQDLSFLTLLDPPSDHRFHPKNSVRLENLKNLGLTIEWQKDGKNIQVTTGSKLQLEKPEQAEDGNITAQLVLKEGDKEEKSTENKTWYINIPAAPAPLSQAIVAEILASMKDQATDQPETLSQKLAQHAFDVASKFPPKQGVKIEGKDFYLSQRTYHRGHAYAVLYSKIQEDGVDQWRVRLVYRSNSNGFWRSTSYVVRGRIEKGVHYTQDFVLHRELAKLLNSEDLGQPQEVDLKEYFTYSIKYDDERFLQKYIKRREISIECLFESSDKIEFSQDKDFKLYVNNAGFGNDMTGPEITHPPYFKPDCSPETRQKFFQSLTKEKLANFYPNFSGKKDTYFRSHTMLSKPIAEGSLSLEENIRTDIFHASLNGRIVEWHFSYALGTKEPWIERIRFADSKITSYGSDKEVIDSGALTLKPFEYSYQMECLTQPLDFRDVPNDTTYKDIRPFLQNFAPIIDYIKYKNDTGSW